jgi:hypothetical protein
MESYSSIPQEADQAYLGRLAWKPPRIEGINQKNPEMNPGRDHHSSGSDAG